jgi:hypothetical protein
MLKSSIKCDETDTESKNNNAHNGCLLLACKNNADVDIIKYFIEHYKININLKDNNGYNCLLLTCKNNSDIGVIKYLIEDCKMNTKIKIIIITIVYYWYVMIIQIST